MSLNLEGVFSPADTPIEPLLLSRSGASVEDLLSITREVFSAAAQVEPMSDPEDPDNRFLVITVRYQGDPQVITSRRLEWHRRVDQLLAGSIGAIRLSVIPE